MSTVFSNLVSDVGSPYYHYNLDVTAPSSRNSNSITLSYTLQAWLESEQSFDYDGSIEYNIGAGVTSWANTGDITFRGNNERWDGTTVHTFTGTLTVGNAQGIVASTSKLNIRLVVTRSSVGQAGTVYKEYGQNFTIPVWNTLTASYDANGGAGTLPQSVTGLAPGSTVTVGSGSGVYLRKYTSYAAFFNSNGGTEISSKTATKIEEASFDCWTLNAEGTGTQYHENNQYTMPSHDVIFYAKYGTLNIVQSAAVTMPTSTECTKSGYTLKGWVLVSDPQSTIYLPGTSVDLSSISSALVWNFLAVWSLNLHGDYVLRARDEADDAEDPQDDHTPPTWGDLVLHQTEEGTALYNVGGSVSGWSIDSNMYVLCGNNRIKKGESYVRSTDVPEFGATYTYITT